MSALPSAIANLVETVLKLSIRPIFWELGKTVVLRETGFVNEKVRVSALLIRNKPGFWQWCKM